MLPFFFHIDTFALVSTIVTGIGTTVTLPSIDCAGIETQQCTQVFERIIAEEKAAGSKQIPDVDCGGARTKIAARLRLLRSGKRSKSYHSTRRSKWQLQ